MILIFRECGHNCISEMSEHRMLAVNAPSFLCFPTPPPPPSPNVKLHATTVFRYSIYVCIETICSGSL